MKTVKTNCPNTCREVQRRDMNFVVLLAIFFIHEISAYLDINSVLCWVIPKAAQSVVQHWEEEQGTAPGVTASHPSLQPGAALLCRAHITVHSQAVIKSTFSSLHLTGVAFSQWIEGNAVLVTLKQTWILQLVVQTQWLINIISEESWKGNMYFQYMHNWMGKGTKRKGTNLL